VISLLKAASPVSNERDRVRGLLGLLPKALSDRISLDYQKSAVNAFVSLSVAILRARRSYDQNLVGTLYPRPDELASWALNLRGYTFGPRHGRQVFIGALTHILARLQSMLAHCRQNIKVCQWIGTRNLTWTFQTLLSACVPLRST
jgi:hypothetical protein